MTIPVRCGCGHQFEAEDALAGGFANCPRCGKATEVPGLRDPLWRMWQLFGAAVAVGAGYLGYLAAGPIAGAVALVAGGVVIWLVSRAF